MITVPQIVANIINDSPYISDAMSRDLINFSALAREIRPQVETELMKRVSHASVVMALKRYGSKKASKTLEHPGKFFGDVSIKSNLNAVTIANNAELSKKIASIRSGSGQDPASYMTVVRGNWATTIVFSNSLRDEIEKHLVGIEKINSYADASALTLRYNEYNNSTPGLVQYPLQLLAWRGISLYQVVSTLDELTIILNQDDVEPAFQALRILRMH